MQSMSLTPRRRSTLLPALLCLYAAAAFGQGAAAAQSGPAPYDPLPPASPYVAPSEAASAPGRARGLFLATIFSFVAQGMGASVGQSVGGLMSRWFGIGDNAGEAQAGGAPLAAAALPVVATKADELVAGIAYTVHLRLPDGSSAAVDPARHVFRTGDRFVLSYRASLPGRLEVSNIDPKGDEQRIDAAEVAAGQLVALGPYEFTGKTGDEVLKVVLAPCSSLRLLTASRSIVKAGLGQPGTEASAAQASSLELPACGSALALAAAGQPRRDIKNVAREGSTSFALDSIGRREIETGTFAPREVWIRMAHR